MDGLGVLLIFVIVGLAIYGTWSSKGSRTPCLTSVLRRC